MFHVSLTVIDLFLTEVTLSLKDQHYSIIIVSSSNNDSVTTCHAKVGLSLLHVLTEPFRLVAIIVYLINIRILFLFLCAPKREAYSQRFVHLSFRPVPCPTKTTVAI